MQNQQLNQIDQANKESLSLSRTEDKQTNELNQEINKERPNNEDAFEILLDPQNAEDINKIPGFEKKELSNKEDHYLLRKRNNDEKKYCVYQCHQCKALFTSNCIQCTKAGCEKSFCYECIKKFYVSK